MEDLTINQARSTVYQFLAQCLMFPDKGYFEEMNNESFWQKTTNAFAALELNKDLDQLFSQLKNFDWNKGKDSLAIEYTRLFVNGCPKIVVSPYAYSYQKLDSMESIKKFNELYQEGGLVINDQWKDRADHFLLALEFTSFLLNKGESEYINKLLIEVGYPWLKSLFNEVQKGTNESIYKLISEFSIKYLEWEELSLK